MVEIERTIFTLKIVGEIEKIKQGKRPEYSWEIAEGTNITRLIGILESIKHDLLTNWEEEKS